jgi:hypothetical protein
MAHFAKLGKGNIVEQVVVVSNDIAISEQTGVDFLNNLYKTNDIWKMTSYNTFGGIHKLGGTPFRKNFAGIGFKYDQYKDAFIEPKPYPSWILNETTCLWNAPVVKPNDGQRYNWNEENQTWDLLEHSN